MKLLVISSHFPYGVHDEFLGTELNYLSAVFESVEIAPLTPNTDSFSHALPSNVSVDLSLARAITPRLTPFLPSTIERNTRRMGAWLSSPQIADILRHNGSASLAHSILERADAKTVYEWAKRRPPPTLAYTFWLGSAITGLRRAWPRVPIVSRAHGSDIYGRSPSFPPPLIVGSVDGATSVRAVSAHGVEHLRRRFPASSGKIGVSRLGLNSHGQIAEHSSDGILRIMSASADTVNKRVQLIATLTLEISRMRPVQWTHFGPRPTLKFSQRDTDELRRTANFAGMVAQSTITEHMLSQPVDLFINLSLSEGVPVTLIEAQSFGIPVLCTDVGGSTEAAPPCLNIAVSMNASASEIAHALDSSFADSTDSRIARQMAFEREFSASVVYPKWVHGLLNIADGHQWGQGS